MFTEQVQSTRERQREQTADRVLRSAQRLFRENGYRATTVRSIADDARVSVGTVMSVGGKDALLLAAYDDWIGSVHRERRSVAPGTGESPADRVAATVGPFLELFESVPELSREYGVVLTRGDHDTEVFGRLAVALHDELATVYLDAGLGEHAEQAARTTYLAYLGLVMTSAATGNDATAIRNELRQVAAMIVDLHSRKGTD